jgi:hypothetical protein
MNEFKECLCPEPDIEDVETGNCSKCGGVNESPKLYAKKRRKKK